MEQWADISNYLTPRITREWVEMMRDRAGIRGFIVQGIPDVPGYPPSQTIEQCKTILDVEGVLLAGYIYPFFDLGVSDALRRLDTFGVYGDYLVDMWLDLEDTSSGRSLSQKTEIVDGWLTNCDRFMDGKHGPFDGAGIYSGRGVWDGMGFPMSYNRWWYRRLWQASYGPTNSLNVSPGFGGFDKPQLWQYIGSTSLFGYTGLDLSWASDEYMEMLKMVPVTPDYWQKFGPDGNKSLANTYDWPGVAANLEGIIHMLQEKATGNESEAAITEIREVLTAHGY